MALLPAVTLIGSVTAAVAQDRKWEVEVHGGGTVATNPTCGTAALPAAGTPFTVGQRSSRRESSWYFGDGAVLLNQVNTALGATAKITALDPVDLLAR